MRCLVSRRAKKLIEARFGGHRGQLMKCPNGSLVICIVSDRYDILFFANVTFLPHGRSLEAF
jgi:hypothetical protein